MLLTSSLSIAQIKGEYVYSAGIDAGTRTLTFNGLSFSDKYTGHMNDAFGEGSFKMANNSLYLNYFKLKDKDSSVYKIDTRKDPLNLTRIYVQVFDEKIPLIAASVAIRDQDFNLLFYVRTAGNGTADLTIRKLERAHYLTVDFIGFNRVTIPLSQLAGKANNIFVGLKPQKTMIEPPRTDVYRIIKFEEKTLTLLDINRREYIFKKVK
ncbi:hypothetical protein EZ449_05270 [Pedobacter frigidisoli]|uniref:Uncharacterized protein n=1 Tax=Pedobacter frigidisoli TaxID=2530455 RepID=A0A4R0P820_9SPHI|nr:hypothetical protein [Pedobacter frigidisoli]TCD11668.1 hypothetical protein EZ449_05270 [Pedobacter frigidisoli]